MFFISIYSPWALQGTHTGGIGMESTCGWLKPSQVDCFAPPPHHPAKRVVGQGVHGGSGAQDKRWPRYWAGQRASFGVVRYSCNQKGYINTVVETIQVSGRGARLAGVPHSGWPGTRVTKGLITQKDQQWLRCSAGWSASFGVARHSHNKGGSNGGAPYGDPVLQGGWTKGPRGSGAQDQL